MVYNFKSRVWKHFYTKSSTELDDLPKIDSHSMVVESIKDNIYILCGFVTKGGVYTNAVYKVNITTKLTK